MSCILLTDQKEQGNIKVAMGNFIIPRKGRPFMPALSLFVLSTFLSKTLFLLNDADRSLAHQGSLEQDFLAETFALTRRHYANATMTESQQSQRLPNNQVFLHQVDAPSCAILLFGLPRSFGGFVLPSLVQNVMIPNAKYNCDFYMHYYHVEQESKSRSGTGGEIRPNQAMLLQDAVNEVYKQRPSLIGETLMDHKTTSAPLVSIVHDTNATFWDARGDIMEKFRTTRDDQDGGNYKYFPYKAKTYVYPDTMDNIVKQWHSIEAVWNEMESASRTLDGKKYDRVAMLRNDVLYLEPIDLYNKERSDAVIIPDFANHPVNDRMIIGPYDAVRTWASKRFSVVDFHIQSYRPKGYGMHSERMMAHSILPLIEKEQNCSIVKDPNICFVRIRADGGIWLHDCDLGKSKYTGDVKANLLEMLLFEPNNRTRYGMNTSSLFPMCDKKPWRSGIPQIYCPVLFGSTKTGEGDNEVMVQLAKRLGAKHTR